MTVEFTFPIPDRKLSPNARVHYLAKSRITKKTRTDTKVRVMVQVGSAFKPRWKSARVSMKWFAKRNLFPDADNCLSSTKAIFDGLTDAGIFDDDRGLTHAPIEFAVDKENPRIEMTITAE